MSIAKTNVNTLRTMSSIVPVSVTDYGAAADGIADDTTEIDNAAAAALTAKKPLVFPGGSYLYSGTVYEMDAQATVINRGYGATNEVSQAQSAGLTVNVSPPATSPQASADTRYGIVVNADTLGEQNVIGIRVNGQNESTGAGATTTCVYGHAVSISTAHWTAAIHGETRHDGGASIAISSESASYTTAGTFYGLVVNNTTATAGATHPISGDAFVAHPSATGILIQGGNNTDTAGGWVYGIKVDNNSMRAGGDAIFLEPTAVIATAFKTGTGVACSTADIMLQGNSSYGIICNGTYTNAAIRVADDQYIALRGNGTIKMKFNTSNSYIEFYSGATRMGYIDMAGADHAL
jgi:hypothetical protein